MILTQRVILNKNGTLTDISAKMNDWNEYAEIPAIIAATDEIIIASMFPFNHKWIEMSVVNSENSLVSVQIWNNNRWEDAVDVIDYTGIGGKSLSKSGVIQFRPHIDKGWTRQRLANEVDGITGFEIYNFYWSKIKLSDNLSVGTAIKYIGSRFSDDSDLFIHYPDLRNQNLMMAFEAGKTDWSEQHFAAADIIVQRLISNSIAMDKAQILDWNLFKMASIHKTAEIIFSGLQKREDAKDAKEAFESAIDLKYFKIDQDSTGELSAVEYKTTTREMCR